MKKCFIYWPDDRPGTGEVIWVEKTDEHSIFVVKNQPLYAVATLNDRALCADINGRLVFVARDGDEMAKPVIPEGKVEGEFTEEAIKKKIEENKRDAKHLNLLHLSTTLLMRNFSDAGEIDLDGVDAPDELRELVDDEKWEEAHEFVSSMLE